MLHNAHGLVKTGHVPNQTPNHTKPNICVLPWGTASGRRRLPCPGPRPGLSRCHVPPTPPKKAECRFFKNYCTTRSAWPEVGLRFCPWLFLFKYWTGGSDLDFSLCFLYVSLMIGVLADSVVIRRWEWDSKDGGRPKVRLRSKYLRVYTPTQ